MKNLYKNKILHSTVHALKRIWKLYEPFHKPMFSLVIVLLFVQCVSLLTPYFTGKFIDALTHQVSYREIFMIVILLTSAKAIELAIGALVWFIQVNHLDQKITGHLSKESLKKIMRLSIGQITNENSGYRQSVIAKGENAIHSIVQLFTNELIPTGARLLVTTIGLLYLSPLLAIVTLGACIAYMAINSVLNYRIRDKVRAFRKMDNAVDKTYSEIGRNLRLVMVNAQEQRIVNEFASEHEDLERKNIELWGSYNKKAAVLREPMMVIGLCLTAVTCVHLVYQKGYSAGQVTTGIMWAQMLFSTITRLGLYQRQLTYWQSLASRYFEMTDMLTDVPLAKNPVRFADNAFKGKVEFRNVSFKYPQIKRMDDEVSNDENKGSLHNVSVTIEDGEICAVVGHSGAGKSTLINMLMRIYDPQEGSVCVSGVDLREIDVFYLRKQIGYVEQEVKLWDKSLRYNILFGLNGTAHSTTDEHLHVLAEKSGISRFYDRLGKKKFEILIGENGIMLSGGERQRVGIARALAKDPRILIFDEATNSLDTINDALIQKAMKTALEGRTGIIIAHRLSTVRHADKIIVMQKGRVVGIGTHDELLESCDHYKELVHYELQALTV